jgi:phospholipid/cholesterol/gamma-HCH transport system substrate-binding protein
MTAQASTLKEPMKNAGKVGVLVVAFFAMLYMAYAVIGKNLFAPKPATYYAKFQDAGGVTAGTKILMAGVNVGTVSEVKLKSATEAQMALAIPGGTHIPKGSIAQLPASLTGIGENVVIIVPPVQPQGDLEPGGTILGVRQGALDSILPNGKEAVAELTKTMAAFRHVLEDKSMMMHIDKLLVSSNKAMGEFGKTAGTMNSLMSNNQGTLVKTLKDASAMMSNMRGMTDELLAMTKGGKMQNDLKSTLVNIREASQLSKIVSDPEMQTAIKGTTTNMQKITDSGVKIAANGESIAANVDKMAKDGPEVTKKLQELLTNANALVAKFSDMAEDVKGVIKVVNTTLGGKHSGPKFETHLDVIQESKPSFTRTDFTLVFPESSGDSIQFGFYDAFESNKLIAQVGKQLSPQMQLRYGIFASKPGFGVDYLFSPKASLRADVFSLNNPHFDLRMKYNFSKDVYGWFGMDRIFRDNAPTIGFGVKH